MHNDGSKYEINNFNTTSKSIFDPNDDNTLNLFEDVSHISSSNIFMKLQS